MATKVTGGCMCGAVRYESTGDPAMQGHCYCRDCQYSSGGSNSSGMFVPKSGFKLTKGQVKSYEVTADSGKKLSRGFCANCGSPLISVLESIPDQIEIRVGSLDDPNQFKPAFNIYMASAPKWSPVSPDLPKFQKMPG